MCTHAASRVQLYTVTVVQLLTMHTGQCIYCNRVLHVLLAALYPAAYA